LENRSDSVIAALAGAPEETVRALSYLPTYETRVASAEAFGGDYETEPPRGIVSTVFDYLQRPQSVITGIATGLLGMDRVENERRSIGADVTAGETRFETAMRRAGEAFFGEDQFSFRDFGKLSSAAAKKDASIWERGFSATFGFGLDMLLDPLTYVSFGGSILGRRFASRFLSSADTGIDDVIKSSRSKGFFQFDDFFGDAVKRNVIDERILVGRIQNAIKNRATKMEIDVDKQDLADIAGALQADDALGAILGEARRIGAKHNVNYLGQVAIETAPEAAGLIYGANGSKALRQWANRHFGGDGEAWFNGLAQDIKGGIRIRLPFYRDKNGVPKAWALPGIGAGRLSEQSTVINRLTDLSENARNWFASKAGRVTGIMSGRSGELWAEAIGAARGKLARNGAVTFADYKNFEKAFAAAERSGILFDDKITKDYMQGQYNFNAAMERHGQKFRDEFDLLFHSQENLEAAERALKNGSLQAFAGSAERAEIIQSAIASARVWRDLFESIGNEAIEVFGDAEVAMNFLKNHVPRITEARYSAVKTAQKGSGFTQGAGVPNISKTRNAFAGGWYVTEENGAQVLRWLSETEANRFMLGTPQMKQIMGPMYVEDPTKFLPMYISEVRSALRDYRITNELHRAGLFVDLPLEESRDFDVSEIWRRVTELVSPRLTGLDGDMTLPRLEEYRRLLEQHRIPGLMEDSDDFFYRARTLLNVLRDKVKFQEPYALRDGSVMYRSLMSFEDATDYRIEMTEDMVSYLELYTRPDWDATSGYPRYYNPLDDSYVEPVPVAEGMTPGQAGWRIRQGKGSGTVIMRPDGSAFSDVQQAAEFMRKEFGLQHRALFVNYVADMQRLAIDATKGILNEIPDVAQYLVSPQRLAQAADLAEENLLISGAVEYLYTVLQQFGRAQGVARMSRAGRPTIVSESVLSVDKEIPIEFIGWAQREGFVDISGVDLDTGARDAYLASTQVRGRIAQALASKYGPKKLMETIGNLFEVRQSPKNAMQRFFEEVYKPFYAVQKVGMTLFRGVGFVHRNILGGLWLGFVNGVGSAETLPSSAVVIAASRALRAARKKLGPEFDANPLDAARVMKEEFEATIRRQFTGSNNIVSGQGDADAIIDLWDKFHKNGLDGRRRTSRVMGEILDASSAMGRMGGIQIRRTPTSRASDYLKVDTDRGSYFVMEEELTKVDKLMRMAMDNPWINFVSGYAEQSEDFLRFAAFIKASKEIGTRDGGYAASLFVKAVHFDYADLSAFERDYLKLLLPFYTWMRYNIPAQFRAMLHDPGKISNALRLNESLAYIFSNDSEDQYPYASYVAERFGWAIPESSFDFLPEVLRPTGPVSVGLTWGEPIVDINRMFRVPGQFSGSTVGRSLATFLNAREIFGATNPLLSTSAGTISGFSRGEPSIEKGQDEVAPKWMAWAVRRTDPRTGEKVVSRYLTEALRGIFPQLGVIERLAAPIAGGERQEGRWLTSLTSALTGLSVATEDDFKAAGELLRRNNLIKQQFDREFGPSAEYRQLLVQRLLDAGASMAYIQSLDIPMIPDEELDVDQYVSAYFFINAVRRALDLNVPEEEVALSLSTYMDDETKGPIVRGLLASFAQRYVSDRNRRVRMFGLQEATEDDLASLGLTPEDVRDMSREEREAIIELLGDLDG